MEAEIYTSFNTGLEPVTAAKTAEAYATITTIEVVTSGYAAIG